MPLPFYYWGGIMATKARTKFNVDKSTERRTYDGIVFDSVKEMEYYRDVILPMIGSGEVLHCELQKPYILQEKFIRDGKTVRPIEYVADFYLEYADGHSEVIDIKGMADTTARLKRKLFWKVFPDTQYTWLSYSAKDGGWIEFETFQRLRRDRKKNKQ